MNITDVWEHYGNGTFKFGVSPRGNGLDTHRTWEMLFFGMVPIVLSSSLNRLFMLPTPENLTPIFKDDDDEEHEM